MPRRTVHRRRPFGTVYPDRRNDGSLRGYGARWTDADGERRHRRGFPTERAANDFVLEQFAVVRAARAARRGETPDGRLPFRDLVPRILDAWKGRVRKITNKGHRIYLRQWAAALGDRPVKDITTKDVQEVLDLMLSSPADGGPPAPPGVPRELSGSSVRSLRWALSGAFQILRNTLGVDVENPCQGRGRVSLPKPQKGGARTLNEAQVALILSKEKQVADAFTTGRYGHGRVARGGRLSARGRHVLVAAASRRHVLSVLANTGLRPAELRRVPWSAVAGDFTHLALPEWVTKTHDKRVVPLPPAAAAALRDLRAELEHQGTPPATDEAVFPIAYSMIHAMVSAAGAAAGLGHVTPYAFRKTYGTELIRKGASIEDVARTMGHRHIQTTHGYTAAAGEGAVGRVLDLLGRGLGAPAAEAATLIRTEEGAVHAAAPDAGAPPGPPSGA